MRPAGKLESRNTAKNRVATIAFLGLLAHALLINVVHHHPIDSYAGRTSVVVACDQQESQGGDRDSSSDSHCVSCCVQRTNISDIRSPSLVVEFPLQTIDHETHVSNVSSSGSRQVLSNRAPPLA
jgi:hypothetical protein